MANKKIPELIQAYTSNDSDLFVISQGAVTKKISLDTVLGIKKNDLLDKTDSETISGEYTFSAFPITPSEAPDADYEVANKKYVDDSIAVEDLWDRDTVNGYIYPKTLTDSIGIGTVTPTDLLTVAGTAGYNATTDMGTSSTDFTSKKYVDDGTWLFPPIIEWYDPVAEGGLPVAPDVGDRYGADSTGSGWTEDYIYEWDGDSWVEYEPEEGWMLWDLLGLIFWVFFSGGWMDINNIDDGTAQGQMAFWDNTLERWENTETSELFWDDTNKRVGIGTASPDNQLHIQGASGADGVLHLSTSSDTDGGFYITGTSDNIGVFSAGTYYDRPATDWRAVSTEAAGFEMKDGGIKFRMNKGLTVGNTHELTDRIVYALDVDSNTKVGVGLGQNVNPSYSMHIKAQSGNGYITLFTESLTAIAGIALGDKNKEYQGQVQYDNSTDKMNLKAYNNTIVTLDGINERVGVGTDSPDYKTHIVGELRVQSAAYAGMMLLGADAGTTTVSTNHNKQARIAGVTYGNSYTMGLFSYVSESGRDRFIIGSEAGNTAVAPTEIRINTALTKGVSGSTVERIEIDTGRIVLDDVLYTDRTNVRVGVNQSTPTSMFHIKGAGDSSATSALNVTNLSGISNLFVRNDGNVGIGTDSPTARLHLPAGTATASTAPIKFTAGTALTTPETGTIEFHDDRFYITNVNRRRAIDRTNDIVTATTEVVNTTTETTIYTGSIESNGLKAGNILKLNASGSLSNVSASDDITIRIYLGTSEVLSFSPAIGNVSDAHWHIQGNMTVRTTGASGTMAYHLDAIVDDHETLMTGLGSVDTTAVQDFTVTVEWDNAKAGNTIEIYQGYTEWKG